MISLILPVARDNIDRNRQLHWVDMWLSGCVNGKIEGVLTIG